MPSEGRIDVMDFPTPDEIAPDRPLQAGAERREDASIGPRLGTHQSSVKSFSTLSRRLGLGVAIAALSVTTLASPISAAAYDADAASLAQAGSTPIVIPMKADIQVTARGKTQVGTTTRYHFLVKNNGPANAPTVNAYKEAHTEALIGSGFQLVSNGYFTLSLAAGQEKAVTVDCTPQAGYYCSRSNMLVLNNPYDPNDSNNLATIQ